MLDASLIQAYPSPSIVAKMARQSDSQLITDLPAELGIMVLRELSFGELISGLYVSRSWRDFMTATTRSARSSFGFPSGSDLRARANARLLWTSYGGEPTRSWMMMTKLGKCGNTSNSTQSSKAARAAHPHTPGKAPTFKITTIWNRASPSIPACFLSYAWHLPKIFLKASGAPCSSPTRWESRNGMLIRRTGMSIGELWDRLKTRRFHVPKNVWLWPEKAYLESLSDEEGEDGNEAEADDEDSDEESGG